MPELETIIRDISTQENKMLMEYVNNFKENNTGINIILLEILSDY